MTQIFFNASPPHYETGARSHSPETGIKTELEAVFLKGFCFKWVRDPFKIGNIPENISRFSLSVNEHL